MRVSVPLKVLFGAQAATSTKGPHWRIAQFAGLSVSAERCYSFTALLHNLSNSANEATLSFGISADNAAAKVSLMLAPGETRAILLPMIVGGKTLTVRCNYPIALLDLLGHQINSGWVETAGEVKVVGLPLQKFPASLVGELPWGASGQLLCRMADCHLLQISCNNQVEISAPNWRLEIAGAFTLLLDEGTESELYLRAPTRTNFSLAWKQFADRTSEWVPPSGMAVWVV